MANVGHQALRDVEAEVDLAILHDARFEAAEANDCFARSRDRLESACGLLFPEALPRLLSIQSDLRSSNPASWSGAVHACRRLLEDLADRVFPAQSDDRVREVDGESVTVRLGKSNYINRLMAFMEDNAKSAVFSEIVGSDLRFAGDRLDALLDAVQKGSHADIRSRTEADRYAVRTMILVSDVLSLLEEITLSPRVVVHSGHENRWPRNRFIN